MSIVSLSSALASLRGSGYVLVEEPLVGSPSKCEIEEESKELILAPTSVGRKTKLFSFSKLVCPDGKVYSGGPRNFLISGEVASVVRASKGKRGKKGSAFMNKPPSSCTKVFGNEGVPRIAHHLNPLKNYLFSGMLPVVITVSPISGATSNYSWSISQLDGISSYTSLYDQYCVRQIEVWFIPGETETTTLNKSPIQLYVCYDPDGSNTTTVADLRQYDDLVVSSATSGQYVSFKPSVALATYGGAFTKYSFEMDQWCDVANTDILQYGLTMGYDIPNSANDFQHAMNVRLWVEFRGVR